MASRRRFGRGQHVFRAGDRPGAAYIVEHGVLRIDRTLASGRSVLFALSTPGDLLGELSLIDDAPRSANVTTLTDASLLVIGAGDLRAGLVEDPGLAWGMLTRIAGQLRNVNGRFVEAAAHGATPRVAARLVDLLESVECERANGRPIELRLPITQEELAQWAGLSREGAVKAIGELRSAGIIETGRKRMAICDEQALRRVAADVG